jgi:tRNA threonylcarbamoyladenosine biosynthesis protein TsaB
VRVLGIESSGFRGGVALFETEQIVAETWIDLRGAHTERLLPILGRLLEERGADLSAIHGIAVSLGPGSFTGLRSGLGLGKGIAYARGLNLVGIPTLEVLAAGSSREGWILAVSDARREEVFFALYRSAGGRMTEHQATRLGSVDHLVDSVARALPEEGGTLHLVGDGTCPIEGVENALVAVGIEVASSERSEPRPGTVARLGADRLAGGVRDDPLTLEPLYVRPSDAEEKGRPEK